MSTKPYLCLICEKRVKFTSRLTRHLNAYKSHLYLKLSHEPLRHKSHNKTDVLDRNWKDKGDLLGKTITIANANDISETPIKDMPQKRLFASEFLSALKEK